MSERRYVEVVFGLPLDRAFHYAVSPERGESLKVGMRVLVPFGKRQLTGYIVGFKDQPESTEVKEVTTVLDQTPLLNEEMLKLTRWMADHYLCSWGKAIEAVLPASFSIESKKMMKLKESLQEGQKLTAKEKAIIEHLHLGRYITISTLVKKIGGSPIYSTLSSLERRGFIESRWVIKKSLSKPKERPIAKPVSSPPPKELSSSLLSPTKESEALGIISKAIEGCRENIVLLKGITASGRMEVYLEAITKTLEKERQAILLVPEISLTPQIVERFKSRFGARVAVLHSGLSEGERYREWYRIKEGEADIVIGARSAIFAPFSHLGLVAIDEEHETSYKQEDDPKYHAREVALWRIRFNKAILLLGSATPTLESYYRALQGEYGLALLSLPVGIRPQVKVVDMREELKRHNRSIFSLVLQEAIKRRLERKEQVILFLNRRGYSTFLICRECGLVLRCPLCNLSLVYHLDKRSIRCHYCGYLRKAPETCPRCRGIQIRYQGIGTQRVEEEIRRLFPQAAIRRMDVDATARKGIRGAVLSSFEQREVDILIGTQLVAKGLDFPGVSLVGVIAADITLNLPDFRASERSFQMLAQLVSRVGKGEVVIQTYNPEHYSLVAVQLHNYASFYDREIRLRKELKFPPFSHLVNIIVKGRNEERVFQMAKKLKVYLAEFIQEKRLLAIKILGPAPAPLAKIKGKHRWQLILKGERVEDLTEITRSALAHLSLSSHQVDIDVDVDPLGMR